MIIPDTNGGVLVNLKASCFLIFEHDVLIYKVQHNNVIQHQQNSLVPSFVLFKHVNYPLLAQLQAHFNLTLSQVNRRQFAIFQHSTFQVQLITYLTNVQWKTLCSQHVVSHVFIGVFVYYLILTFFFIWLFICFSGCVSLKLNSSCQNILGLQHMKCGR